jgi:hypothetical protein
MTLVKEGGDDNVGLEAGGQDVQGRLQAEDCRHGGRQKHQVMI